MLGTPKRQRVVILVRVKLELDNGPCVSIDWESKMRTMSGKQNRGTDLNAESNELSSSAG